MTVTRQDAWTKDDDLLLAEVTLRHIREGGTQLQAFEEVGQRLGRTPAACGFRWNSLVRKKYETAIQIAKAQRQQLKSKNHKRFSNEGEALDRMGDSSPGTAFSYDTEAGQEWDTKSATSTSQTTEGDLTFDDVIRFLRKQKESMKQIEQFDHKLQEKEQEIARLKDENQQLKKEMSEIENVHEDYQALLKIMERARKLAFLGEEDDEEKISFKMDKNGNLERVEKE